MGAPFDPFGRRGRKRPIRCDLKIIAIISDDKGAPIGRVLIIVLGGVV
jgi:hypothetical protein